MKFSLLVLGSPYSNQSMHTALRFAQSVIASNHKIYRIFFYHDAVNAGNRLITPPQDEVNIPKQWAQLADAHQIDLVICIASALKRGILNPSEAERHQQTTANISDGFEISGLGQLIDASVQSDRLISFGP